MKKTILSLSLLALASVSNAAEVTLGLDSTCDENGTDLGYVSFNGGTYLNCELPTSIDVGNMDAVVLRKNTLANNELVVWTLPGIVVVGAGNTQNANPATVAQTELEIEAGTHVAGAVNSESALIISRGSKIKAVGTAQMPIVFSSLDNNMTGSGEWGGLVIASFGESNACPSGAITGGQMGDACTMEGVATAAYYGSGHLSAPNTMSSGTLSYVVIAEGGHVIQDGNEINGLTLYAVNSSTTINNIHVQGNADDGVEFFGGNVAVSNMWMACNEDDSVDWDLGFHGFLSNVNIKQGDVAGYALELANSPTNNNALPRSNGTVLNMSIDFVGASSVPPSIPFDLKQGTGGVFSNVVIGSSYNNPVKCMRTDTAVTGGSHWSSIEYVCDPTHAGPSAWNLPASNSSATGFTANTFWAAAPSCQ